MRPQILGIPVLSWFPKLMPACAKGVEGKPDYLAALSLVFLITISNISTLCALMLSMVLFFFDFQN